MSNLTIVVRPFLSAIIKAVLPSLSFAFTSAPFSSNAVRHGGYVTEISVTCREEDGGKMVITVEDDGIGVPAEMKEKIFKRGVGSNTGLGLFLVREVLAITGMSIRETGEEGKGACFEITVPPGVWRRG